MPSISCIPWFAYLVFEMNISISLIVFCARDNDKEAESHLATVVSTLRETNKRDPLLGTTMHTLATAQLRQGKAEEAEKCLLEAISHHTKYKGADDPAVAEAKELLEKARAMMVRSSHKSQTTAQSTHQ